MPPKKSQKQVIGWDAVDLDYPRPLPTEESLQRRLPGLLREPAAINLKWSDGYHRQHSSFPENKRQVLSLHPSYIGDEVTGGRGKKCS